MFWLSVQMYRILTIPSYPLKRSSFFPKTTNNAQQINCKSFCSSKEEKRQEDHELDGYSVRGKFNILLTRKRALTEGYLKAYIYTFEQHLRIVSLLFKVYQTRYLRYKANEIKD